MTISESKQGNVTILKAQGKLDAVSSPEVDKRIVSLVENGTNQIALDLADVDYVSSAGLRVFLSAAKRLKQAHGKLALANLSVQVQQIFDIAGFESILPVFKTIDEAVAACSI
ncbi:MAG: STAS domain-containing protein [Kiritimatiellia bacterium]|jgi:anti-anti-sigma factor